MLPKIMKLFVLGLELGFLQNVYESKCDKDPLKLFGMSRIAFMWFRPMKMVLFPRVEHGKRVLLKIL